MCKRHLTERVAARKNSYTYLILSNWVEANQDVLWPSDSHLDCDFGLGMSYAIVLHPTYLETWGSRRSATPLPRPAACDNLLAPNMAQTDLCSFLSYKDGAVA